MSKFKVGDRVIYSGNSSIHASHHLIGKKGKVSSVSYISNNRANNHNITFDDGQKVFCIFPDNLEHITPESSKIYTEQTIKVIEPNHYGNRRVIAVNKRITTGDDQIDISIIPMLLSKDDIADMIDVLQQIHEVL